MRKFLIPLFFGLLLEGCGTTRPSYSLNEIEKNADSTSYKELTVSSTTSTPRIAIASVANNWKFPFTISCLLKNKTDADIAVVAIIVVEEQQAVMSGLSFRKFEKISKGVYKLDALLGTTSLDLNLMTIAGTGVNSKIYGDCHPLN